MAPFRGCKTSSSSYSSLSYEIDLPYTIPTYPWWPDHQLYDNKESDMMHPFSVLIANLGILYPSRDRLTRRKRAM